MPNDDFYRTERPEWLRYFISDWLKNRTPGRMNYLEGWQADPNSINYDIAKAFLYKDFPNMSGLNWDDQGPAGPRWHGSDRTPLGDYIKEPWSPERYGYWDEEAVRETAIKDLLNNILKNQ